MRSAIIDWLIYIGGLVGCMFVLYLLAKNARRLKIEAQERHAAELKAREDRKREAQNLQEQEEEALRLKVEAQERHAAELKARGDRKREAPLSHGVLVQRELEESQRRIEELERKGLIVYNLRREGRELEEAAVAQAARDSAQPDFAKMSGVQFEAYLMKLLTRLGYTVRGTKATGDQGADMLAMKAGRTIVIQAKNYRGAVGNGAVQEVLGAVHYYDGDEGWVITNSAFTTAAKELARKAKVKLIDGDELKRMAI